MVRMQQIRSDQMRSVTQSCPALCDPMNRSMPRLPLHHQLKEFTQRHVHRVIDAIQPSHPLSSPSPPAPNLSQHQDTCIFMAESLHWSPETITTLFVSKYKINFKKHLCCKIEEHEFWIKDTKLDTASYWEKNNNLSIF